MTQVSIEGNLSSSEGVLVENEPELTTSDVIKIGEDLALNEGGSVERAQAHDSAHGFILHRAADLAQVGAMNFSAYESERSRLIAVAREFVDADILSLDSQEATLTIDQQVEQLVVDAINASTKPLEQVLASLAAERSAQHLEVRTREYELEKKLLSQQNELIKQAGAILQVRKQFAEKGVSEEDLRDFDYTTSIMMQPERETYEVERGIAAQVETLEVVDTETMNLFRKFIKGIGEKALGSISVFAPKSAEVEVVKQDQSA